MSTRRPLRLPIFLAIVMITILLLLTAGWIVMSVRSALESSARAPLYWAMLSIGATLFVLVLVGVVIYLTLSIKAINLSRRQSNFIDSVTHELKSPLASLKLYLQTLNRLQPSEVERQEFYRAMLDDVERLDQLINHVLDAARLDRPVPESGKMPVALDELLTSCAAEVCQRHRVPLSTIRLDLKPCIVSGWQVDLELIFRNLLDNAIKYAGKPPEVVVTLKQSLTGQVCVQISDNGRGIPYNSRQKVFGRFVRLGTELERDKPGLGLGLFIVRTLVARLRGRVRVRSREDKSGTTFEVLLPGQVQTSTDSGSSNAGHDASGVRSTDATATSNSPQNSTRNIAPH
ncbi:MAG: HAMP domain-containing histidine kinase [Planctomycetales bacterium]|nr:HAMP domain-containing histidine kinase [Planctomycetales bacterium]